MDWIIIDICGALWGEFVSKKEAIEAAKKMVSRSVTKRLYVGRGVPEWDGNDDIVVEPA